MRCNKNVKLRADRHLNRRGFTLTELMVVMVIIGLLATAGFLTFKGWTVRGRYSSAIQGINQINSVISTYYTEKNRYPESIEEAAEFMKEKIPAEDPWDRPWDYRPEEDGYYLGSSGEKESDDEDDVYYDSELGRIINKYAGETPEPTQ